MSRLLKYIRIGILAGPRVVLDYFRYVLPMSRHPERYPLVKRYNRARKLIVSVLSKMKLDVRAPKFTNTREKPCLFVCNHVGALDPLVIIAFSTEPVSFISKMETRKMPVVGRIIRMIDGIFLDRDDPFQAVRCFQTAKKKMAEGWSYCIFPEGTREKGEQLGHLLPFHPGSFKIGYMAKCEVSLIANFGSFHPFSNERLYRSNLVQIKEVDHFSYDFYKDMKSVELSALCEDKMCLPVLTLVQEDKSYIRAGQHKDKCPRWWKGLTYLEEEE